MVQAMRDLLESYDVNVSHKVVKSGSPDGDRFYCDTNGLHIGDRCPFGKILEIGSGYVRLEQDCSGNSIAFDVYDYVSDQWLQTILNSQVLPIVRRYADIEESEATEHFRCFNNSTIMLSHKHIRNLKITGGYAVSTDLDSGILRGSFNGDIVCQYTYGELTDEIKHACVLLLASFTLGFIGASTGGGSLSVQGYSRSYGQRGKYHDIRQEFDRMAYQILQKHTTGMLQT